MLDFTGLCWDFANFVVLKSYAMATDNNTKYSSKRVFNEDLKNLWDQYILIQEQLLKRRCAPICIDPKTISVEGHKFTVNVDETGRDRIVNKIFTEDLKLAPEDIEDESILVQETVWQQLNDGDISSIQKELASCYIELDWTPSINANLFYGNNINIPSNNLTLSEIRRVDAELREGHICKGKIDDKVACIIRLNVNTELYYLYLFGENHYRRETRERHGEPVPYDLISYRNHYIPAETLSEYYQSIGLRLSDYQIHFKIDNDRAREVMNVACDYYDRSDKVFKFKRPFRDEQFTNETLLEIQNNIRTFNTEALHYCTKDEISFETVFNYRISPPKTVRHIFKMVADYVYQHDGMSFNSEKGDLGIDFNWEKDDIVQTIKDLEKSIPFVEVRFYGDNHKFKCKVTTEMVGYDDLESRLRERFQDISIENNPERHCVHITLPCQDIAYYDRLSYDLARELTSLQSSCGVNVDRRVPGKVRLRIKENDESRIQNLEDSLKDMRKVDFGFDVGEKTVPFGRLLSVTYPRLTFDIDIPQPDKEAAVFEFLERKSVSFVVPILTGDLEKISRLKNTFSMASSGEHLLNDNLQNFIFDSHLATKTEDIEYILRRDGGPYTDLCEHLLNNKINESQKDAILKCLYAKDMAVIQGPPGSGKSTAIAELIWQLIRYGNKPGNKKERILLTSETNLAVDNAISRILNRKTNLVKPIRLGDEEKLETEGLQFSIELMKKWVESGNDALILDEEDEDTGNPLKSNLVLNNWLENISRRSFYSADAEGNDVITKWRNLLESPSKELRKIVYNNYVSSCNVIGATCSSIGDTKSTGRGMTQFFRSYKEVFKPKGKDARIEFTTVIQDESSKATPAELVLPFVYGNKAIVIGDHRQLPPMLDREEMEKSLDYALSISKKPEEKDKILRLQKFLETQFEKIEESHFQRLYENIDPSLKETFNLQYRMHPDINDVIKQFYLQDGGLNCGLTTPKDLGVNDYDFSNPASRYHGIDIRPLIGHNTHVLFVNTDSPEMLDGTSRVNYGEVEVIGKILDRFESSSTFARYLSKFSSDEEKQIGVISFYGKQIKLIRALANEHKDIPIRVSTVDRFQGMERNIIIVSMVRSYIIQSYKGELPNFKRYEKYGYPEQNSLGFAQSPNRLNVALSRAKRLLIIVGNEKLFSSHPIYKNLFETIRNNPNNKIINQNEL